MPDPRRDSRGLKGLTRYLSRPRTIEEIMERFELAERSAYRWMEYLKADGADLVSRRDNGQVRYAIT